MLVLLVAFIFLSHGLFVGRRHAELLSCSKFGLTDLTNDHPYVDPPLACTLRTKGKDTMLGTASFKTSSRQRYLSIFRLENRYLIRVDQRHA